MNNINKSNNNYILKEDICYSTSINNLETLKDAYVICIDGKSKGVFKEIPEEYKYQDLKYAKKSYQIFANAIKKSATTHLSVFATRHRLATEVLMEKKEETKII